VFGDYASRHAAMGLDMSLMTSVNLPNEITVWLVPGSVGTCLAARVGNDDYTSVCGLNQIGPAPVATYGLAFTDGLATGEKLIGVVPDGNPAVTLTTADGGSVSVPVTDNAFVASTPTGQPFTAISSRSSSGSAINQHFGP
jgi:hypothetical protein